MQPTFDDVINHVDKLLSNNSEWIDRYEKYAKAIKKNIPLIESKKKLFHQWPPLFLYMNISNAKGKMDFHLRYQGQDVAVLKADNSRAIISTKTFDKKNLRDFNCNIKLDNSNWRSKEASQFREYFSSNPKRTKTSGKGNEEHRIESLLLTELSKKKSQDKIICGIQPVTIGRISRFQMPTPIKASKIDKISYSGRYGGGIDILARVGKGKGTKLCIMEIKDQNTSKEPPKKVILQGIAYATFIHELLRYANGDKWWKLFGFSGTIPKSLEILVGCAMPLSLNQALNDKSFALTKIHFPHHKKDSLTLHYFYFQENLGFIDTSLR